MIINYLTQPFFDRLVHAVIMVESGGNFRAVSPVGAQGLMQLMPKTGKELHRRLNLGGLYDPFNIPQNVAMGSYYLRQLLTKYEGDAELALTAYNQGMGRVDKLLRLKKATTLAGIISELGPDGKAYAKKVLDYLD
jgi:soluble lytic murein transglycosylase-like protein